MELFKENIKKRKFDKLLIILGSLIVAFGLYNIHSRADISEGGELGIALLIYNWFNISPAIVFFVVDITSYTIGTIMFGKKFLVNALIGTISCSFFYAIFENIGPIIPDLSNSLLLATILGGIFIGVGCGIVVRHGGACGGDDSMVLIISKITKLPISICYFLIDIVVIGLALSYINYDKIIYSILTAAISSLLIGCISNKTIKENIGE